jgi:uncharacterized cupredoxin-like copper-binding protein
MKKFIGICIVLMVLSSSLTACGSAGSPTEIDVTMTDYHYSPTSMVIPSGKEVTLNIKNDGSIEHEFVIMKYGTSAGDEFGPEDEDNIYWEVELDPHSSQSVTFTAPGEVGKYEIVCGTPDHLQEGMRAALTVTNQ